MAKVMTLREQAEALPIHAVGGYEWECATCHYHMARWDSGRRIEETCPYCGRVIGDENDGQYIDSTGRVCDHEMLLDRAAVLELLRD